MAGVLPAEIGGLNRTHETLARSNRTPGGWGAEESGNTIRTGREATGHYFAGQLGGCWAELGPHYDSINEA